jgi:NADP-dependent 3-hydroxy acid dehydrogenase YdfG
LIGITGKIVLITGASSGLGRELALKMARRSTKLIVTARRKPLLDSLAAEVEAPGSECLVVPADATDPGACVAVLEAGVAAFGRIDVPVLNAGAMVILPAT